MFEDKIELTNKEAVKDCIILSKLILSIIEDGIVEISYGAMFPSVAEHEVERTKGVHNLMDKYSYGWYFTINPETNQKYTKEEQIANVVEFQSYILSHVGEDVIRA